jgi:hypothetical protein
MTKAVRKPAARKARAAPAPTAAVVGGGLAGMTAALRLAQRGFAVTLYEAKEILGGNFSSDKVRGVYHDVYPHMFCAWYANFWALLKDDLGLGRDEVFSPRDGVKILNPKSSTYAELENATTPASVWRNLHSGVMSPADMFLLGFSMLDLAATPFQKTGSDLLERLDVNGFVYSRGYSTEKVAKMQNYILMVVWSIQSDVTAAASYQDFIKHTMLFPRPTPFSYLLKGSLQEKLVAPFEAKLVAQGCRIKKGARVDVVELVGGKPKLTMEVKPKPVKGRRRGSSVTETVSPDYIVLATPASTLGALVLDGKPPGRLVDAVPTLSEVRRFASEAIPVIDIYFKKKLPDLPKEQVGLADSDCDLTMLDISQLWTDDPDMKDRTALVVAASNGYALTSDRYPEQGYQMIEKLHEYLPVFKPGKHWGDPDSDIDWGRSHFRPNSDNRLFVNDIGSWQFRPVSSYPQLPNVFFAGDYCQTDVDMATVEAAVQSGLLAAKALQARDQAVHGSLRGEPIAIAKHEVYSDAAFLAAKLLLLPLAYAATAWSAAVDGPTELKKGAPPPNSYSQNLYSLLLPLAFSLDWWKTAYWLVRKSLPGAESSDEAKAMLAGVEPSDTPISLRAMAAEMLKDLMHTPDKAPTGARTPTLPDAMAHFLGQAWRTAQAGYTAARLAAPAPDPEDRSYRRRWRVKT